MHDLLKACLRPSMLAVVLAMLALMGVSLMAVQTAELADPLQKGYTMRQAVFAGVGLGGFLLAAVVPYHRVGRWAYVLYGLTIVLLIVVFLLPAIRYSRRWIRLGSGPSAIQFQPSELAKLTYIVAMAWYLRYRENFRRLPWLIPPFLLTLTPAVLVLLEPDLGTSLLFFPTLFFMLLMAGARLRHMLGVLALALIIIFLPVPVDLAGRGEREAKDRRALAYWNAADGRRALLPAPLAVMQHHQLIRIEGWLRQSDPDIKRGKGYQLDKSMTILGSGGLSGAAGPSDNGYFRMLPDDHTDFIFAVIGGRWGFVGCMGVLLLYVAILIAGAEIAARSPDPFGRLLAVGVIALLFTQVFINVGMTLGMAPITGMTLPFVSYGGSSMLINSAALGLLVNVSRRKPILLGRRPFEHGQAAPEAQAAVAHPLPTWR